MTARPKAEKIDWAGLRAGLLDALSPYQASAAWRGELVARIVDEVARSVRRGRPAAACPGCDGRVRNRPLCRACRRRLLAADREAFARLVGAERTADEETAAAARALRGRGPAPRSGPGGAP